MPAVVRPFNPQENLIGFKGEVECTGYSSGCQTPDNSLPRGDLYVTLQLLWKEYRQANPAGYRYSRFCDLLPSAAARSSMWCWRQEHKGGEEMLVGSSSRRERTTSSIGAAFRRWPFPITRDRRNPRRIA